MKKKIILALIQGRLMHLIPGKSREDENEEAEGTNYKKKKALKEKKEAGLSHNWNSLFLGTSAVADLMSEKYSVEKADVVLGDAGILIQSFETKQHRRHNESKEGEIDFQQRH